MTYQFVKTKREGEIAVLTLDRPPVNALSPAVVQEVDRALDEFGKDAGVRALVITGAGTNAFSAGADVNEMAKLDPKQAAEVIALGHRVFRKVETFERPVIAAVNNLCLGGGMELSLSCDMRISSDRARFGQPEVQLGLIPGWGGSQRLSRLVGPAKAKELIFTGQMINAQQAFQIGLVNMVVPDGDELRAALDIGKRIAVKCAPLAVAAAKRAINQGLDLPIEKGLEVEQREMIKVAASADLAEGIKAFVEKRPAKFTGK